MHDTVKLLVLEKYLLQKKYTHAFLRSKHNNIIGKGYAELYRDPGGLRGDRDGYQPQARDPAPGSTFTTLKFNRP